MKSKIYQRSIAIVTICLCLATPALTQSYDLSWFTIDGGGGSSSGGAYSASGTIGQHDAGHLAGGGYTLSGGFWGVVTVIQSEGAPLLSVSRSGGSVVVNWPFPSPGFTLQQTIALASPPAAIVWTEVLAPVVRVGPDWTVTVPSPSGNRFFRLRKL